MFSKKRVFFRKMKIKNKFFSINQCFLKFFDDFLHYYYYLFFNGIQGHDWLMFRCSDSLNDRELQGTTKPMHCRFR